MSDLALILVVEDSDDLRKGMSELLRFEGYGVLSAAHGLEALRQMELAQPDLILSDISMPEMDGIAFYQAVRRRPEGVSIPFIFLTARGQREDMLRARALGVEDYLVKPVSGTELLTIVQARLARFSEVRLAQLRQAYTDTVTALANAIEVRDRYTRGHIERVTEYSLALGRLMGLNDTRLENLRFGAILHDIGKLLVDPLIWTKPGGLTPQERQEIEQHTVRGAQMIQQIEFLGPAAPAILYHHERWQGGGYPANLNGEAIPLEARIVAVADSFDAITTTRPYSQARSLEDGLTELERNAGTLYDPQVLAAFRQLWESGVIRQISQKWLIPSD